MNLKHVPWLTAILGLGLFQVIAHSSPPPGPTPAQTAPANPSPTKPIPSGDAARRETTKPNQSSVLGAAPIESDWRARSLKWFKASTIPKQRKEMRAASRALKKPCKYCHTKDFKGYTAKRLIAQQMMALSAENDVGCHDCHAGRGAFTELGRKAKPMWKLVHHKKVFCDHCHIKQT